MHTDAFFNEDLILKVCHKALFLILELSAPMLISALVVGLVISIMQATTQVQEQTLSFVPKIIATFAAVLISGSWIGNNLASYTTELIKYIPRITESIR